MPLGIATTNEEKIEVTCHPQTALGKPAQLDGALRITVTSGDATFEQDPATPNAFWAISSENPGTTEYLVEGDADLGTGETLIQDVVTYEVSGAQAANFGLSAGPAVPKTESAGGGGGPEVTPSTSRRK